jgi:hypothetical protein
MIGLGRMGGNMARRLTKGGHQCVVFDRNRENGSSPRSVHPGPLVGSGGRQARQGHRVEIHAHVQLRSASPGEAYLAGYHWLHCWRRSWCGVLCGRRPKVPGPARRASPVRTCYNEQLPVTGVHQ